MKRRDTNPEPEVGAPMLLVMFIGAILIVVAAIVTIGLTDDGWVVVGAVALVGVLLAGALALLHRGLRDDEWSGGWPG